MSEKLTSSLFLLKISRYVLISANRRAGSQFARLELKCVHSKVDSIYEDATDVLING